MQPTTFQKLVKTLPDIRSDGNIILFKRVLWLMETFYHNVESKNRQICHLLIRIKLLLYEETTIQDLRNGHYPGLSKLLTEASSSNLNIAPDDLCALIPNFENDPDKLDNYLRIMAYLYSYVTNENLYLFTFAIHSKLARTSIYLSEIDTFDKFSNEILRYAKTKVSDYQFHSSLDNMKLNSSDAYYSTIIFNFDRKQLSTNNYKTKSNENTEFLSTSTTANVLPFVLSPSKNNLLKQENLFVKHGKTKYFKRSFKSNKIVKPRKILCHTYELKQKLINMVTATIVWITNNQTKLRANFDNHSNLKTKYIRSNDNGGQTVFNQRPPITKQKENNIILSNKSISVSPNGIILKNGHVNKAKNFKKSFKNAKIKKLKYELKYAPLNTNGLIIFNKQIVTRFQINIHKISNIKNGNTPPNKIVLPQLQNVNNMLFSDSSNDQKSFKTSIKHRNNRIHYPGNANFINNCSLHPTANAFTNYFEKLSSKSQYVNNLRIHNFIQNGMIKRKIRLGIG